MCIRDSCHTAAVNTTATVKMLAGAGRRLENETNGEERREVVDAGTGTEEGACLWGRAGVVRGRGVRWACGGMGTTRLSCSSAWPGMVLCDGPSMSIKQCRKRNNEGGIQVPHARTISDRCRLWTSHGMHEYGMLGNVFGGDHHHPDWLTTEYNPFPLRAVLYGPVRRPSVSRVDLTVTVFGVRYSDHLLHTLR